MLDVCWALFEIRLHADPERLRTTVWADLTGDYLGIMPHPELSWWAMRGQLIQEPGYMVNYALGPLMTAALRAAIRDARGELVHRGPGWYEWVSARVYRFGRERTAAEIMTAVTGAPLSADALAADIARAR